MDDDNNIKNNDPEWITPLLLKAKHGHPLVTDATSELLGVLLSGDFSKRVPGRASSPLHRDRPAEGVTGAHEISARRMCASLDGHEDLFRL